MTRPIPILVRLLVVAAIVFPTLLADNTHAGSRIGVAQGAPATHISEAASNNGPGTTGRIKLTDIVVSLHRRAAQLLEDLRGSEQAPAWAQARLGPLVTPLYRPDIDGIAYYEFLVVSSTDPSQNLGFIIVSTGQHDFPIAHWNATGGSPTQTLTRIAEEKNQDPVKFYKLDALSYAAEDAQGNLAATLGSNLVKLPGQAPASLDQLAEISEASWRPNGTGEGAVTLSGPQPSSALTLSAWGSWAELKSGYSGSYETLIQALRQQASTDWETDTLAEQIGEGLRKGQTYPLALLYEDAEYTLAGDGVKAVKAELLRRDGLPPVLNITVADATPNAELPLDVTITYPNEVQETVKFVIVEADGGPSIQSNWSPWYTYWAGSGADQRWYGQMSAGDLPNSSACWSGCGATAWAMLFGWADKQAAVGNPDWAGHWGIYRQNGGYGNDAVAPISMDGGVRNMIWELRNQIRTFCSFDLGATFPWDMWRAYEYLINRNPLPVITHYNGAGIPTDDLRNYASASIMYRGTPAIIGTGWLNHYPLAYGYQWRTRTVRRCWGVWCWNETEYAREFYVNQGWGGPSGWVPASTWFAGEIYPY